MKTQTTKAKMQAFLKALGLDVCGESKFLSSLNNRPVLMVKNADAVLKRLRRIMPGTERCQAVDGVTSHTFVFHDLGTVSIRHNVFHPKRETPVFVTPFLDTI